MKAQEDVKRKDNCLKFREATCADQKALYARRRDQHKLALDSAKKSLLLTKVLRREGPGKAIRLGASPI